jgi:NAD dependent epimerase/dehydratase family enzyme
VKCIVSGGTGFIGRRIVERLLRDNHYVGVWSRRPGAEKRTAVASFSWDPLQGEPPDDSVNTMDAVIHLAGETVAQRWNAEVKRLRRAAGFWWTLAAHGNRRPTVPRSSV